MSDFLSGSFDRVGDFYIQFQDHVSRTYVLYNSKLSYMESPELSLCTTLSEVESANSASCDASCVVSCGASCC